MKKIFLIVFLLSSLFSCNLNNEENVQSTFKTGSIIKVKLNEENPISNIGKNTYSNENNISKEKKVFNKTFKEYKHKSLGLVLKNNDIFYDEIYRGFLKDNRIYIPYKGYLYSFDNILDIKKLSFSEMAYSNIPSINYGDLRIVLPFKKSIKIIYKCNGALVDKQNYEYCKTNSKDYLSQYEFGRRYMVFTTGGGWFNSWGKIYIRKILGQDIVFQGDITGVQYDEDPYFNEFSTLKLYEILLKNKLIEDLNIGEDILKYKQRKNYEKMDEPLYSILFKMHIKVRNIINSKIYLDTILEKNKEKEKIWKKIVNSFSIEKIKNKVIF